MTQKRTKQIAQGKPLLPPMAVGRRYGVKLRRLVAAMNRDYVKRIKAALGVTFDAPGGDVLGGILEGLRDKWDSVFAKHSQSLANGFIREVVKASNVVADLSITELTESLTLRGPKFSESMQAMLDKATQENVELIRSLPIEHYDKISKAVTDSLQEGGQRKIYDEAMQVAGMTSKRAEFIATDQTRKLNASITRGRMSGAGIAEFTWHSSTGSAQPRELHAKYNGKVFRIDDPPVIDERTGQTGMPGEVPNCRCYATPVVNIQEAFGV